MNIDNRKKYNTYSIFLVVGLAVLVYIYNDFLCFATNCYELEVTIFEPFFFGALTILPTLLVLRLFQEKIFISWLKFIAWWFILLVAFFVGSNENESDFSPFANDVSVVSISMALLFIITLIYALVMKRKLRGNS